MRGTMTKRKVRKLFSTGQVAELVGTNPKTVAGWFDKGILKGVKLPGLGERRVHREELRGFLARYEYIWAIRELDQEEGPLPAEEPSPIQPEKPGPKKKG
jgi:excisionase family DNA binding protein